MSLTPDDFGRSAQAQSSETLYSELLGAAFDRLPALIRRVHDARNRKLYAGRCRIRAGAGWMARLIAWTARLPPAQNEASASVLIERRGTSETWTRRFGGHEMRSQLRLRGGVLEERLGAVVLTFALKAETDRIIWRLTRARLGPLPLPLPCFAACTATEWVDEGRYSFDVRAELRGVGLIAHYSGWLAEHG